MIAFAELRAQGWRIAAALFGVLAVALFIWCAFLLAGVRRERADAIEARNSARAAELHAQALTDALARDATSDAFTATARTGMDANAASTNARLAALESKSRDRPPVPPACPSPDPDLMRESAEAAGRFRAAEGRLRDLRAAQGGKPD